MHGVMMSLDNAGDVDLYLPRIGGRYLLTSRVNCDQTGQDLKSGKVEARGSS